MRVLTLLHGDCVAVLGTLDAGSVSAVICDPPYGLEFMGKDWDGADGFRRSLNAADVGRNDVFGRTSARGPEYRSGHLFQEWVALWAVECLRVLKPGGHLVAFGGTRTYHRLAAGVEDAGFEIRDTLAWMYGTGFPKSLDVSKAIDAREGHLRGQRGDVVSDNGSMSGPNYERTPKGEPVTAAAAAAGWGTALKPAYEPIVLARKPLTGTVASTVMENGTGALNIDATRVQFVNEEDKAAAAAAAAAAAMRATADQNANRLAYGRFENGPASLGPYLENMDKGRWPANIVLDEDAAALLDESVAPSQSRKGTPRGSTAPGDGWGMTATGQEYDDEGGPSRFFYCAKATRAERDAGLGDFDAEPFGWSGGAAAAAERGEDYDNGDGGINRTSLRRNGHPTVKPISLMRWLVRLIAPPGGIVVDPFLGSGTTGVAARLEGFPFVGIEQNADYIRIARSRIAFWEEHGDEALQIVAAAERADREREATAAKGQLDLLGEVA